MTCKHLIGMCAKTRMPCPHCLVDGQCDEAACTNEVVPTWSELLDIYKTAMKPTRRRFDSLKASFNTLTRTLGITLDDKVAVTDEQLDAAYATLKTDHEPESIESIFNALKASTSDRREMKMEYRKRGKQRPDIDLPRVEKKAKAVVQLTDAQRLAVRERMVLLRNCKGNANRNRFLWLFFAWEFGVRPNDISRLRWNNIVTRSNGSTWLDYIPHKTEKSGRHAGGKLTDEQVAMVMPFTGKGDELIIPLDVSKRPVGGSVKVKHGEFVAYHASLRRYFINFMKSIGVNDKKPQYALRKDCSQQTIRNHGVLHEAQMLGHTPKVAMTNYTDISKLELKEGL